ERHAVLQLRPEAVPREPGLLARLPARAEPGAVTGISFRSASQTAALPSEGARQSPRGESEPPEPTFGPLGRALRLNWLVWKKRRRNTSSQRRISPSLYFPCQACAARNATLAGA